MTRRAFAPASVTAVFVPLPDGEGSQGVSFALDDGVEVAVDPAAETETETETETRVTLRGDPTAFAPVTGVLDRLGVTAAIDVRPEIPVGCGFGASGAATLATALAADAAFDLGRSRDHLVEAAHRAEVAAGTGLGDVFVQDAGGVVYDLGDGRGRERVTTDERVSYASYGGIATEDVLGDADAVARVRERGRAALDALSRPPALSATFEAAWPFARETGLTTARVERAVERVHATGGAATMAMVGETVVGLGAEGALDRTAGVANEGARRR